MEQIRTGAGLRAPRTAEDGRFALDAHPEHAYIVAVIDETWAAQSLMNVVVREGQSRSGLDFTLSKGTLLHGQITEGPDHRPSSGAMVMLNEKGEVLPKDYRGLDGNKGQLMRATMASDALGRYQFRVGPGRYTVEGFNTQLRSQGGEDVTDGERHDLESGHDLRAHHRHRRSATGEESGRNSAQPAPRQLDTFRHQLHL